jgi:acetate kinase
MNVLAINCGSSTLKFQLFQAGEEPGTECALQLLARGMVDRIGEGGELEARIEEGESWRETAAVVDHADATRRLLNWLRTAGLLGGRGLIAVGHRVVHGGDRFVEATIIDDEVLRGIEEVSDLAPLHNGPALSAIRGARATLGDAVPMVAVFDTAFHRTLPPRSSQYAIPWELSEKHMIRRYGFHGIAHQYMAERYAAITTTPAKRVRLVTLQLGNGCSATAVDSGRSVDTSMGFTPLEGLVMGTRSGDLDPSLVGHLASREGVPTKEVEEWLNTRSGLLGVSGRSRDMRELLQAEAQSDSRAALAVEMFCYRVRKYIGAYLAALGGADAVIFGGGIGENASTVRARICSGMEWCGLILNLESNATVIGKDGRISTDGAAVHAYVIGVDEGVMIARDTVRCLQHRR